MVAPWISVRALYAAVASGSRAPAGGLIAYLSHGGLWLWTNGHAGLLAHASRYDSISTDGRRIAWITEGGAVSILAPPLWKPGAVPGGRSYTGEPFLLAGTPWLFAGGSREGGDDGLWRVDARSGAQRMALHSPDVDFSLEDHTLRSPGGRHLAAWGLGDATMWLQVLNLRT